MCQDMPFAFHISDSTNLEGLLKYGIIPNYAKRQVAMAAPHHVAFDWPANTRHGHGLSCQRGGGWTLTGVLEWNEQGAPYPHPRYYDPRNEQLAGTI